MHLSILYRGSLSSCNYACNYCPFAKHKETQQELRYDKEQLTCFINWATEFPQKLSVLFTPWGEALIRPWYQEALQRLTQLPRVQKAAIQTNLSCPIDWVEGCDKDKLALWATYHPTQTSRQKFLQKCKDLLARGVRFSVGVVGLREHLSEISALRDELPSEVYLWVNAYKRAHHYYSAPERDLLSVIDPLFFLNDQQHESLGHSCRAGAGVISVDGAGEVTRCHFIKERLGNLYQQNVEQLLLERPCTNETCGCHIGYVHLDRLRLYPIFQGGVLERIPAHFIA
jgi:MoaA/NifB/PqqE/SkfB family radical SAM enzyme